MTNLTNLLFYNSFAKTKNNFPLLIRTFQKANCPLVTAPITLTRKDSKIKLSPFTHGQKILTATRIFILFQPSTKDILNPFETYFPNLDLLVNYISFFNQNQAKVFFLIPKNPNRFLITPEAEAHFCSLIQQIGIIKNPNSFIIVMREQYGYPPRLEQKNDDLILDIALLLALTEIETGTNLLIFLRGD